MWVYADIYEEICIKFQVTFDNLNKTFTAYRLYCKMQGAINWAIIKKIENSLVMYLFLLTLSKWYHEFKYRTIHLWGTLYISLNTLAILRHVQCIMWLFFNKWYTLLNSGVAPGKGKESFTLHYFKNMRFSKSTLIKLILDMRRSRGGLEGVFWLYSNLINFT